MGRRSLSLAFWLVHIGPVTFCMIILCGSHPGGDAAAPHVLVVWEADPKAFVWVCCKTLYFLSCSDGTELQREGRLALGVGLEHPTLRLGVCDTAGEVMKLVFPLNYSFLISARKCPRG